MKNNSTQPWYEYFIEAAKLIPLRAWLWLAGVILAVPTSYYGFVWLQYKLVKQQTNCYTDLYENIDNGVPVAPDAQMARVIDELSKYNSCNKAVNPKIGTIDFVRKEYGRGKGR